MEQQSEFFALDAVADLLKVGIPTVQSLINRGLLESQTQGQQTVVPYRAVLMFLRDDQRKLLDEHGHAPDLGLVTGDEPEP
jgi:phage terminase Nu1 subunit (DNA packaging protein)